VRPGTEPVQNVLIVVTFNADWSLCTASCGHYMYCQFNNQKLYVLLTHCTYVFVWIWEQTAIISLYSINWLVFITETECLLRCTDWVFVCFVWIREQTAIISLYNINWLVCITEMECVYCAVQTVSLRVLCGSENTAIISLYSINWPVFLTETDCLLRGTDCTDGVFTCFVWIWEHSDYFPIQH
jgi:hypothetical protein